MPSQPVRCPHCGQEFGNYNLMMKHNRAIHHTPPKFLKRFNCIRCGKKLTKEEHEIDTGNLCEDCRKVTINEDAHQ
jgi:DNA-directed RNA polymerase subunit RPC12/RpoP